MKTKGTKNLLRRMYKQKTKSKAEIGLTYSELQQITIKCPNGRFVYVFLKLMAENISS